ncbi:MAG: DUF4177 domain-containing protein [Chitinophagaceae bacterium]|nr:DUF4177 domain-containing protein [Chitinophagaceae bacterium]
MKRFEYKTVVIERKKSMFKIGVNFNLDEIDKVLNEMGNKGWELVTVEDKNEGYGDTKSFFYTFKREI